MLELNLPYTVGEHVPFCTVACIRSEVGEGRGGGGGGGVRGGDICHGAQGFRGGQFAQIVHANGPAVTSHSP